MWLLFFALLVPAIIAGYAIGDRGGRKTETVRVSQEQAIAFERRKIQLAPAFSADDLSELPKDAWLTNGGSLANQRYSPSDEIDTSNADEPKGVWMTNLRGSGTAAKYSAEGQPIVYQGIIYIPTGDDDVFAVSLETGVRAPATHLARTVAYWTRSMAGSGCSPRYSTHAVLTHG